ncbi:MAG TPA: flagellar basal body-associated FliL family protein [Oxalicibacterium sp.]|jgi:flagellar basal body-associated protein FliL|nr:flagellar basal body-associated FliL family protein [Oxalicibacterium sp.]
MAKPAPKPVDRFVLYTVVGALAFVAIGFLVAWFYFKKSEHLEPQVSYVTFGPLVVRASDYSIRTSLAVQTANEQEPWIEDNKQRVEFALQNALSHVDEERVRQPDGIAYLQDTLRDEVNRDLKTKNVQEVLLTDFIIQSN